MGLIWCRRSVTLRRHVPLLAAAALLVCCVAVIGASRAAADGLASWPTASHSILGDRTQPLEFTLNPHDVSQLAPKWVFTDHGDVSATPTVADGAVYFPDFGGYLNAVDARTGKLIWQRQISSYPGESSGQLSRNSPLIYGNELILGDNAPSAQPNGAHVFAVSRADGSLLWSTEVDSNQAAIITSNPVAIGSEVVVGVASNEEADAESSTYPCCSFRGAVVALDAHTGRLMWKTYTVPSNNPRGGDSNLPCTGSKEPDGPTGCGYTGGAVWATPTIDPLTDQVFVGTGNNYTAPDPAVACANAAANNKTSDANCSAPDDYFDAVVSLNLLTGRIDWGHKVEGWDAWNVACDVGYAPGATWCPSPQSPDYDFGGSSPNLMVVGGPHGLQTLVGDGQKSGIYWAFDAATGKIVWDTLVGPGSSLGGIEWGSAYDGQRVYTAEANADALSYTVGGQTVTGGSWAALDPATGKIQWQTVTPDGWSAIGPVSEANGVVYGATMNPSPAGPDMYALDASTGAVLWSFDAGSSVNSSPAIVDGTLYWGSGYGRLGPFLPYTGNDKFYAFSLHGK